VSIEAAWENQRDSFAELPKPEFDGLYRGKHFAVGPLRTDLSKWGKEFGPYNPERWAFGELTDGRRVCAKIQPG
jgi:hypothetical protein